MASQVHFPGIILNGFYQNALLLALPLRTEKSMESPQQGRLQVWWPLLSAGIMVLGMTLGFRLHDTLRSKRDMESSVERNDRLEEIIDLIGQKYVDTVSTNALYSDAVKGILSHLDPHTVYIPADELADVNQDLEGSFFGIGVEFAVIHDTIEVTSVVEGGPSDKAGVLPGDKFLKVNDTLIAGNGTTSERIVQMLRSDKKSTVSVWLKPARGKAFKVVHINRDEVPLYSVDASLMLDPQTGYIKINRFAATTYDEFAKAIHKLKADGAKQLVLDLRENPGGYLDAAVNIADEFLDNNKLVVYTQGIHAEKTMYRADKSGMFEQGKLAVLVDESSASAAEILSGAIQDWDRGIIIGRRTFGKGLVQEQYDLGDGAALRLTIARYYTPSGRCIQRTFANGKDAYEADFEKRFESGELTGKDSLVKEDTTSYYTANHRLVHGGGGIKPDVYVPYDSGRLSQGLINILLGDALRDAIWDYYGAHTTELSRYPGIPEVVKSFNGQQDILANYLRSLPPSERMVTDAVLQRPANKDYLLTQIRAQVARILFRNTGYYAVTTRGDDMIQRALKLLYSADYSKIIGR